MRGTKHHHFLKQATSLGEAAHDYNMPNERDTIFMSPASITRSKLEQGVDENVQRERIKQTTTMAFACA